MLSKLSNSKNKIKDKKKTRQKTIILLLFAFFLFFATSCVGENQLTAPGVTFSVGEGDDAEEISTGVQLLVLLTVLSLAPSILILATSFTRIIIVLSLLRNAIGTPSTPPNQVLIGFALLLTFFSMAPVYNEVNENAFQPFIEGQITQEVALERASGPLRDFMFRQTHEKDLDLFISMNGQSQPETLDDISMIVLLPAFVVSELRTAFTMGFVLYVPFLVIDMVVASVLLAMGMMMLPPSLISLPFKLLLFVLTDGWFLITQSLLTSFY